MIDPRSEILGASIDPARRTSSGPGAAFPEAPAPAAGSLWGPRAAATAIVLVVLVTTAFLPCLGNDFVSWDDQENFLDNPHYRGLNWPRIRWAWTTFRVGVYQPLAWMILEAQYALFGLRPWGYHLTSLIFYALDTAVLFVVTVSLLERGRPRLRRDRPVALVVGAGLAVGLFAVHPLRAEVVAWASCQPYLPCALFSMLAVLAYLRAFPEEGTERRGWLIVAFGLFAAALLFKAVAVSLPAVLLILDIWPLRRLGGGPGRRPGLWRVWCEKVPFAGLSAVFMVLAYVGRMDDRHLTLTRSRGLSAQVAQACYAIWFYPIKTIWPWQIAVYYPMPARVGLGELPFLLSLLGTLGVSVGALSRCRGWPGLSCAWFSYLVILAPTSGLVRIGSQIAADRYSYMAMMGMVVLLADGICRTVQAARRAELACAGLAAAVLLPGLALLTRDQCRTWQSSDRLWAHALDRAASRDFMAYNILGATLLKQGRDEEAVARLVESLRLKPDHTDARFNLGLALSRLGQLERASAQYAEALRLDPGHVDAQANLGAVLARQGRLEEAAARFAEAVRLDPDHANAHYNLGLILSRRGPLEEARAHLAEAVRLDPDHANAHSNLGVVLARQGRLEEAAARFAEAVRLDPGHADAHNNLGTVLSRLGRPGEALAEYAEALRLNPENAEAHRNRARIWATHAEARFRDGRRAVEAATRACELTEWEDGGCLDTLAAAYAEAGDFEDAVRWQALAVERLSDERRRADARARLELYRTRQPYRETITPPQHLPQALRKPPAKPFKIGGRPGLSESVGGSSGKSPDAGDRRDPRG